MCTNTDLLVTQLADDLVEFKNLTDAAWTKLSTLDYLDPLSVFRITNQIQSGIVFAIKSEKSQRIARNWFDSCVDSDYSFLIDPSIFDSRLDEFREHRYVQSILSLIVKSEGVPPLKDETWFHPDWTEGLNFPIWALRNRSGGDVIRKNYLDRFKIFAARVERKILSFYRD